MSVDKVVLAAVLGAIMFVIGARATGTTVFFEVLLGLVGIGVLVSMAMKNESEPKRPEHHAGRPHVPHRRHPRPVRP